MNILCDEKKWHSDSSKRQSFQSQSNALYQNSCLCAEFLLAKFLQWVSRQRSLCLFASRLTSITVMLSSFMLCVWRRGFQPRQPRGSAPKGVRAQGGLCPRGSVAPRRTSNRRFTGDCIHSYLLRRGATEPPDSLSPPLHVLHVLHGHPRSSICQSVNHSSPSIMSPLGL